MRIAVTGSTGLLGRNLCPELEVSGHRVIRLVRTPLDDANTALWIPETGAVDRDALGAIDAIIHLAGENIAAGRWNAATKQRIAASRGPATRALCRTLADLDRPPTIAISASATGIYGDRGDDLLDESSATGTGEDFLAQVALDWEQATAPLSETGTRIVHARFGVVLDRSGGALQRMLLPFRLGLGGCLGNGRHWMSWITRADATRALLHMLGDDDISGPVLTVAPEPVTNRTFTKTLGKALRRPTLLPMPRIALKILFGELADVLLASQRAVPTKLSQHGFVFEHGDIESALRAGLKTPMLDAPPRRR